MERTLLEVTENLKNTLISCIKILIRSRLINIMLPNASPEDEIVILGNGPSLKDVFEKYPDFLLGKKKMCVNSFAVSDQFERIKPEYYVFADPGWWIKKPLQDVEKLKAKVLQKVEGLTWKINFLLPNEARNSAFVKQLESNKLCAIYYYNKTTVRGFKPFIHLMYKKMLGMPRPQTVLVPALMLGINMQFKKIFLLGADHSWHEDLIVDEDNVLCIKHQHFTEILDSYRAYIPVREVHTGRYIKIYEQFESLTIIFRNYLIINDYAKYRGSTIWNASLKSYIDAFERYKI